MLKKLKKVKWYWWLLLGIYISLAIFWTILPDITEQALRNEPLEVDWLPYIHNYYEFWGLIQMIHLITLFTGASLSSGYLIIKGISMNVKKEN